MMCVKKTWSKKLGQLQKHRHLIGAFYFIVRNFGEGFGPERGPGAEEKHPGDASCTRAAAAGGTHAR